MKKIFILLFFCFFVSSGLEAQTRTRKIPFLPYAGINVDYRNADQTLVPGGAVATTSPSNAQVKARSHKTILFDKNSSALRDDQRKKLLQVGKWLEREGGGFYYVHIFTSPEISVELARRRGDTVIQALSDFRVGEPIVEAEYRRSPVINPNRVEVYLSSPTGSLGSAATDFGSGPVGKSSSNFQPTY